MYCWDFSLPLLSLEHPDCLCVYFPTHSHSILAYLTFTFSNDSSYLSMNFPLFCLHQFVPVDTEWLCLLCLFSRRLV